MVASYKMMGLAGLEWPSWPTRDQWEEIRPITRSTIIGMVGLCAFTVLATLAGVGFIEFSAWRAVGSTLQKPSKPSPITFNDDAAISLQRPLFMRSRQGIVAAAVVAVAPTPVAQQPDLQRDRSVGLKGVFMNGQLMKAFLISNQNPAGAWIAPNETVGGWRLATIRPQEVELEAGGQQVVVPLSATTGSQSAEQQPGNPSPHSLNKSQRR